MQEWARCFSRLPLLSEEFDDVFTLHGDNTVVVSKRKNLVEFTVGDNTFGLFTELVIHLQVGTQTTWVGDTEVSFFKVRVRDTFLQSVCNQVPQGAFCATVFRTVFFECTRDIFGDFAGFNRSDLLSFRFCVVDDLLGTCRHVVFVAGHLSAAVTFGSNALNIDQFG